MTYHHLTIFQREELFRQTALGRTTSQIAKVIGCDWQLFANGCAKTVRQAPQAHGVSPILLADERKKAYVSARIYEDQWSPEEIEGKLKREANWTISWITIYRGIARGYLSSKGFKVSKKHLRRRGKPRKSKEEKRGKIAIPRSIEERPDACQARLEAGHLELDMVLGKQKESCLVTAVDRKSRFLWATKILGKQMSPVKDALIQLFQGLPEGFIKSFTPDRGKEFSKHAEVEETLGVPFYFPDAHAPWQRGTNENTNGLLREYFKKYHSLENVPEARVQVVVNKLNDRPRKCLGFLTPREVFLEELLHFV